MNCEHCLMQNFDIIKMPDSVFLTSRSTYCLDIGILMPNVIQETP